MTAFVAGMLILILLAAILIGWTVTALERETRRQSGKLDDVLNAMPGYDVRLRELKGSADAVYTSSVRTEEALAKLERRLEETGSPERLGSPRA